MPTTIAALVVPTHGRSRAVVRCVASYLANAREFGHRPAVMVSDDAGDSVEGQTCRQHLRAVLNDDQNPLMYLDRDDRLALRHELIRERNISPEVASFALFGIENTRAVAPGANRNLLLLKGAGNALLMVDDDTVCVPHRLIGKAIDGARLAAEAADVIEIWPLAEPGRAVDVCRPDHLDCLLEYGRWLGVSPLTDCPEVTPPPDQGSGKRVGIVAAGLVGDCGWGSPSNYLTLTGASRRRLTKSDTAYSAFAASRHVVRAVRAPELTPCADSFMSTFIALDASRLLPPFLPICRGEDRVFARLTSICCPDLLFLHIPMILAHEPIERRRFWPGEVLRSAAGIDLATLVCALLDTMPSLTAGDTPERLRSVGSYFEGVSTEASTFRAVASQAVRRALDHQAQRLRDNLAGEPAAAAYRRDIERYLLALRAARNRGDLFVPLDLRIGRTDDDAESLTRCVVRRFGSLLRGWPEMYRNQPSAWA